MNHYVDGYSENVDIKMIRLHMLPGGVTQDEDDDDEQENDGVTPVLGAALPLVDGDEDADVETEKKNQWQYSQQQQSKHILDKKKR